MMLSYICNSKKPKPQLGSGSKMFLSMEKQENPVENGLFQMGFNIKLGFKRLTLYFAV